MALHAKNIKKILGSPGLEILKGISFEIKSGEFVSLRGKSGSGKSTLLYILSTLDAPSEGSIVLDNTDISLLSAKELHDFRNKKIGFVFQFHYLLPELTALENVLMPARKSGKESVKLEYAQHLLQLFGLEHRLDHLPKQLSGGEQQRVSIARSLVMNPIFLFADEPTGNLDSSNTEKVLAIFEKINHELATTIVMVTHDNDLAKKAGRTIELFDGQVIKDQRNNGDQ